MIKDHPNPYLQASLRELSAALDRCARHLRTANGTVEREDMAHLLLAAAKRLAPQNKSQGEPLNRVRAGAEVLPDFWPRYEREKRAMRWHLFHQAAEAAGLTPADLGEYFTLTGRPLMDRVVDSEEGYCEALIGSKRRVVLVTGLLAASSRTTQAHTVGSRSKASPRTVPARFGSEVDYPRTG